MGERRSFTFARIGQRVRAGQAGHAGEPSQSESDVQASSRLVVTGRTWKRWRKLITSTRSRRIASSSAVAPLWSSHPSSAGSTTSFHSSWLGRASPRNNRRSRPSLIATTRPSAGDPPMCASTSLARSPSSTAEASLMIRHEPITVSCFSSSSSPNRRASAAQKAVFPSPASPVRRRRRIRLVPFAISSTRVSSCVRTYSRSSSGNHGACSRWTARSHGALHRCRRS
jgi:hypothetical protein